LMRTVEVLFVIIIIVGAFIVAAQFAVLPSPREIFGTDLRELAVSTLQTFDAKYNLSRIVFNDENDPAWGALQKALSASLPPNIVYNLTVFSINTTGGAVTYYVENSISNAEGDLGTDSEAASCLVTSSEVTFGITPEKIGGEEKPRTLYILNCEDANGWWITGYTGQSLASDCYNLLSPYFETTVLVNTTEQLELLLENSTQIGGTIQNAVVINTFGEAVPIPSNYCEGGSEQSKGYQSGSYAKYCHTLGVRTRLCNWTWVSIVGYPLFYVTNTETLKNYHNGYRIYGMRSVGAAGLNNFLRGLDSKSYSSSDNQWLTKDIKEQLEFTSEARDFSNYYGIYPAPSPMASRALPVTGSLSIESRYQLTRRATMFKLKTVSGNQYSPAATFSHNGGGALTAIGLTRIPDIRITVLDLLMYYRPNIFRSEFGAGDTSRLVTLQLSQQGGT